MKKRNLKHIGLLLIAAVFMIGCHKETLQSNEENAPQSLAQKSGKGNSCPVTSFDYYVGFIGEHQVDHYIYKDGLVDEWKTWYGMDYKLEYEEGKLKRAKGYSGDDLVTTILFFYDNNNRVTRETWYSGNTTVVDDEVIYSFDRQGQIIKGESTILNYYTENVYTPSGDLESWKYYSNGSPVMSGHYTYNSQYKSPLKDGTPGVEYNFPYINATFGQTKWWYSSEKIILYDEFGTPSVYYEEDPGQTQWQIGHSNIVQHVDYVDRTTGTPLSVGFQYENCRPGGGNNNSRITSPVNRGAKKITHRSLLQRNPSISISEQVKELRRQVKSQQQ